MNNCFVGDTGFERRDLCNVNKWQTTETLIAPLCLTELISRIYRPSSQIGRYE